MQDKQIVINLEKFIEVVLVAGENDVAKTTAEIKKALMTALNELKEGLCEGTNITINMESLMEKMIVVQSGTEPLMHGHASSEKAANSVKLAIEKAMEDTNQDLNLKITTTTEEIWHHESDEKSKDGKRFTGLERIIRDHDGRILYSDYIDKGYFLKRKQLMGVFDVWNMAHE